MKRCLRNILQRQSNDWKIIVYRWQKVCENQMLKLLL